MTPRPEVIMARLTACIVLVGSLLAPVSAQSRFLLGTFSYREASGGQVGSGILLALRGGDPTVTVAIRSSNAEGERWALPAYDDITVWMLTADGGVLTPMEAPASAPSPSPVDWGRSGDEYFGWTFEFEPGVPIAVAFRIRQTCYLLPWFTLDSQGQSDRGTPCDAGLAGPVMRLLED